GVKNRVRRIHDAVHTRRGRRLNLGDVIDLTVAESTVVAPATTKHLVAFDSKRCQPGLVLVIDQTIAEIEDTGPSATGNDLIERIKRIEGIRQDWSCHLACGVTCRLPSEPRRVWRGLSVQAYVGGDGQGRVSFRVKGTRRNRRQFVVLFHVVIVKVGENLHLITTDLVVKGRITTPSFLLRIGT